MHRRHDLRLPCPAIGPGSLRRVPTASASLVLFSLSSGAARANELATTLKQRLSEVLEGKRPLAEVTVDVVGGRPDRRSLTVYGSGGGIWNREKQFTLDPAEHVHLLKRLITSGLFEMPERPRPARNAEPSPNAPMFLRSVGVRVGDLERVVAKCHDRMAGFRDRGKTFFLVSHSLAQVEKTCHRAIWLLDGEVVADGEPSEVCERYWEWARDGASMPGPAAGDGAEAVPESSGRSLLRAPASESRNRV